MLRSAVACVLTTAWHPRCREYNADGLRLDAAHLLPKSLTQYLTFKLRQDFPGKLIVAELNPFEPSVMHDVSPPRMPLPLQ